MSEIAELQTLVRSFCDERDWKQFHTPKELAIGMVTESSELLELFRFQSIDQMSAMMQDDKKREEISDELADTFYFLLRFCDLYGFDISDALKAKLEKNAERYPVQESRGVNAKASH